jgi:hypothetical protein
MSNEQAAPATKGVAVELLATLDLGPEIEGDPEISNWAGSARPTAH